MLKIGLSFFRSLPIQQQKRGVLVNLNTNSWASNILEKNRQAGKESSLKKLKRWQEKNIPVIISTHPMTGTVTLVGGTRNPRSKKLFFVEEIQKEKKRVILTNELGEKCKFFYLHISTL